MGYIIRALGLLLEADQVGIGSLEKCALSFTGVPLRIHYSNYIEVKDGCID